MRQRALEVGRQRDGTPTPLFDASSSDPPPTPGFGLGSPCTPARTIFPLQNLASPVVTTRSQVLAQARALDSDEAVKERVRELLPEGLEQLRRIMSGDVRRNDALVLKSIQTALQYTQPLPKQTVEHEATVSYRLIDPYALPPVTVEAEVIEPAAPAKAVGPVIRRAAALPAPATAPQEGAP